MINCVCGIDIGTTSLRVVLINVQDGSAISFAQKKLPLEMLPSGFVHQCPEIIWSALCEATNEAFSDPETPLNTLGVAISAQRCSFMGVDREYRPVTGLINWMDNRGVEECRIITDTLTDNLYNKITGMLPVPQPSVSKIVWLKKHDPSTYEKIFHFTTIESYALFKLGVEQPPITHTLGSYMGILDNARLEWSTELLEELNLDADRFPELVPSGTVVGAVSAEASYQTGIPVGTPLVTAGGDLQCAGLGAGIIDRSKAVMNMGTAAGILAYSPQPEVTYDKGLACPAYTIPGTWEVEGHAQASSVVYEWFNTNFGGTERILSSTMDMSSFQLLDHQANLSKAGAGGLIFFPTMNGAGAPFWMPQMKALLAGLTLQHTRNDIIRSVLEGISVEMSIIAESLMDYAPDISEICVVGGGAKSDIWNQIHADIFNVKIVRPQIVEASIIGACVCAAVGVKWFATHEDAVDVLVNYTSTYEPNPRNVPLYQEKIGLYKRILGFMKQHDLDCGIDQHVNRSRQA